MQVLHNFLIEPFGDKLYDNTKDLGNGNSFITSASIENHTVTNRQAIVASIPVIYNGPVKEGALVVVHHNVFRKYLDIKGKEKFASTLFRDNLYTASDLEVFAYKNDWNDEWTPIDPYCFVEPIANDDEMFNGSEKALHGVMKYSNEYLKSKGVDAGTKVGFAPESEYEFNLDGLKLYRIKSDSICMVL